MINQLERERLLARENMVSSMAIDDFNHCMKEVIESANKLKTGIHKNDQNQNILRTIIHASERAVVLLKQIRSQYIGSVITDPGLVDINHLLKHVLSLMNYIIPESVHIQTQYSENITEVRIDCSTLEQIFINSLIKICDQMSADDELIISTEKISIRENKKEAINQLKNDHFIHVHIRNRKIPVNEEDHSEMAYASDTQYGDHWNEDVGFRLAHENILKQGGFLNIKVIEGKHTIFDLYLPGL